MGKILFSIYFLLLCTSLTHGAKPLYRSLQSDLINFGKDTRFSPIVMITIDRNGKKYGCTASKIHLRPEANLLHQNFYITAAHCLEHAQQIFLNGVHALTYFIDPRYKFAPLFDMGIIEFPEEINLYHTSSSFVLCPPNNLSAVLETRHIHVGFGGVTNHRMAFKVYPTSVTDLNIEQHPYNPAFWHHEGPLGIIERGDSGGPLLAETQEGSLCIAAISRSEYYGIISHWTPLTHQWVALLEATIQNSRNSDCPPFQLCKISTAAHEKILSSESLDQSKERLQKPADVQFELGIFVQRMGRENEGLEWIKKSADQRYHPALFTLADKLYKSKKSQDSTLKADALLLQCAEEGFTPAKYELAKIILTEAYHQENVSLAYQYLTDVGGLGNTPALHMLGDIFLKGSVVSHDLDQAYTHYEKAAVWGFADSQYQLGKMHFTGQIFTHNLLLSLCWLTKAAAQNHKEAANLLKTIDKYEQNLIYSSLNFSVPLECLVFKNNYAL